MSRAEQIERATAIVERHYRAKIETLTDPQHAAAILLRNEIAAFALPPDGGDEMETTAEETYRLGDARQFGRQDRARNGSLER